ncbi:uncharacterized protein A1O5_06646 [Cladophialophora psammophila CBS 110553]|uniref:Major facilitator superfamily (MFS) profile domain-containing protein n=1 Tax=Cladophialophora psammophila CBS 110553 TaxID=1182543 RepID=W9X0X1_9EURO|nr:uncharacterized protein A1O5_06646 [Cladophialophora psammophila CBS 110553]EXJ70576.1 hypothetical protein A1O5_06646 [Cladophialophora psammophila CBS 110553]
MATIIVDKKRVLHVEGVPSSEKDPTQIPTSKVNRQGIVLVPQPSDDPQDPLNWSTAYKVLMLGILCLGAFSATCSAVANSSGFVAQAKVYHKTPIEISYSVSAGTAGVAAGPLLWLPITHKTGRVAGIFWGMALACGCTVWSALMTAHDDYNSFVVSRLMTCLFASVGTTTGSSFILEMFYLHQRGRAFAAYSIIMLSGTTIGPTFSGFIVQGASWTVQFWYLVALHGVVAILAFFFLYETGYTRPGGEEYPRQPRDFWANRLATLFGRRSVVANRTWKEMASLGWSQIRIFLLPVTLIFGGFQLVIFGWAVAFQALLAVFLQTPVGYGGYGFSPGRNAACWFTVAVCLVYGHSVGDRLSFYIARRYHKGIWKPEHRLHSLWIPLVVIPIGLGLIAASLQYHLHYMVLALGSFVFVFGVISTAPVSANYLVECFTKHSVETTAVVNFYRLILGLTVPFYVEDWEKAVHGPGWVFGMMALFTVAYTPLLLVLVLRGSSIRRLSAKLSTGLVSTEEGMSIAQGAATQTQGAH